MNKILHHTNYTRILHLIPFNAIGGVERAALTMGEVSENGVQFSIETIFPPTAATSRWVLWNPWFFVQTIVRLYRAQPAVLIVSLWRAYAVGIVLKLLRPRLRLVVFLHLPNDVHGLDYLLTRVAKRMATQIWADARETLVHRLPGLPIEKGRVISFVTEQITPTHIGGGVQPIFIFWGRIHPRKGLKRAIRLFAMLRVHQPGARYLIIGPDGGDLADVQRLVADLELTDAVEFYGPKDFSDIRKIAVSGSFYLQTSEMEGMAMSVVEAMQLGLVPVVTPVGESARYCRDGYNAIVVRDDAEAVAAVLQLLDNVERFQTLRTNAMAIWRDKALYKDDVIQACHEVLKIQEM